jgi:uncharacterized membrane protein YgcG
MRAILAVLVAAGCAAPIPLPMTAADLARQDSGPALVAYLAQPDANPAVCDRRARGPHLGAFTPDVRDALIDGLARGQIDPALWRRCLDAAMQGLPPDQVAGVLDAVMRTHASLVTDGDIESDPAFAGRVATLQRLYVDRASGVDGHPEVLTSLFDDLRGRLAKHELGPVAQSFAQDLLANVDVEHGVWQGHPVDRSTIDGLAAAGNEMTLTRFANRLPRADLRDAAKRRLVRVHIELSAFDEVRTAAAEIEDKVAREGHNRVSLIAHPLVRAWFDERVATIRHVLVRQHVWNRTATLLGSAERRPKLSVLPELSLRGTLWAELDAVSRPVTLCAPDRALDPTPCIDLGDVSLDNRLTYLDRDDAFHFRDSIAVAEIAPWASRGEFRLQIGLGGAPAVSLRWGLSFERPDDLVFRAEGSGERGPDLDVRISRSRANRYVFTVDGYTAIVEAADLARFHVASRGAAGAGGAAGTSGSTGSNGGECENGGNGGNGSDGGPGGDGGDGGDIHVAIACGGEPCDVAALEAIITSTGGDGGWGGQGGAGGSGGWGGSARAATTHTDSNGMTVTDDAGCSAGTSGSSGSSGANGAPGSAGHPGHIQFVIAK